MRPYLWPLQQWLEADNPSVHTMSRPERVSRGARPAVDVRSYFPTISGPLRSALR